MPREESDRLPAISKLGIVVRIDAQVPLEISRCRVLDFVFAPRHKTRERRITAAPSLVSWFAPCAVS